MGHGLSIDSLFARQPAASGGRWPDTDWIGRGKGKSGVCTGRGRWVGGSYQEHPLGVIQYVRIR